MNSKKYPNYLKEFVNELQIKISSSLKSSGCCTKKGNFTITQQVEKYLIRKFKISKRMKQSDILTKLGLDQNVLKDRSDTEPSTLAKFKIRLGNKLICNYTTLAFEPIDKSLILNPIFHWEFIREVQMKENEANTHARHQQLVSDCAQIQI